MGKQPLPYGAESNEFAVALYRELAREPGNLHFSPFSIRLALGMALAGAGGETAEQIRSVLRIPASDDGPATAGADTIERLTRAQKSSEINVANSFRSGPRGLFRNRRHEAAAPRFVVALGGRSQAIRRCERRGHGSGGGNHRGHVRSDSSPSLSPHLSSGSSFPYSGMILFMGRVADPTRDC